MIADAIAAARQDLLIRELIERVELREMCLGALKACTQGGDLEAAMAVMPARLPAALTADPDRGTVR